MSAPGPSATILIVDDSATKRLALHAALAPLGHPIVEADSGVAALHCIAAQDFAVILLDIRMPDMDGFETADLIRKRRQSELTPIIFITAYAKNDVLTTERYAENPGDFIFAPVVPKELRAMVSTFADQFVQSEKVALAAAVPR